MKTKHILTAIAIALATTTSCDNLLDVKNPSNIYGEGYWSTKGEVESYLTGTYTTFRSCCNSLEYFEARGDEFEPGLEGGGSNQWAHNLTSLNGISWGSYYTVIQNCNMIIDNIDKASFSLKSDKDQILAEAYTMRAYMFFCLTRLWGDVPLETEATKGSSKPLPSRATCDEAIGQVLKDLETAIGLFPTGSWPKGKSRASKPAAYALMADAYLWKAKVLDGGDADLQKVIEYADIAAEGTGLESDFSEIYGSRNGQEVIWSIHFGYPEITDNYTHFLTLRDVFVEKAVNKAEIPYAKSGARSSYSPSEQIKGILGKYKGDVRKDNAYVIAVDKNGKQLGVSQRKMPGTKTETNVIFDNDIILYRTAEMILFKAEAYAALGDTESAVKELDRIRDRAGIGKYTGATDKRTVEKEILDERGREFWLENKRWPDLLRFHHEGVIDVYQYVPKLKARYDAGIIVPLYFAIPLSELSLNHNLVQTTGYENL